MEGMFKLMNTSPEVKEGSLALDCRGKKCEISFDNVVFKYSGDERKILDGVNLTIEGGKVYGV